MPTSTNLQVNAINSNDPIVVDLVLADLVLVNRSTVDLSIGDLPNLLLNLPLDLQLSDLTSGEIKRFSVVL